MPHTQNPRTNARGLLPANPLRRLRWQLTLSYMGWTVAATLMAELLFVLGYSYFLFLNNTALIETVTEIQTEIHENRYLFQHKAHRVESLQYLLDNESVPRPPGIRLELGVQVSGGVELLVVTDAKGAIIARYDTPESARLSLHQPLTSQLPTDEAMLFDRALHGENRPTRLVERTRSGAVAVAVPIRETPTAPVWGVVHYRTLPLRLFPIALAIALLPELVMIAVFSGLGGLIVGAVTARRVTDHIGGIATAADAWAGGDLSTVAPDAGGDELSLLARRLNRMAHELGDLFTLRREVATVQERNRLARDLHDTVKQQVFAASLQIATARALATQNRDCLAPLMEAEALVRQAQTELTDILRELRPLPGDGSALPDRLAGAVADWARRTGIAGEFLTSDLFALGDAPATALLRITQEALANIAKHSGATTARVFLNADRATGTVSLAISDNGRGFDTGAAQKGFGLQTMRERTENLPEGRFLLQSAPGAGTRIEVRFRTHPAENTP